MKTFVNSQAENEINSDILTSLGPSVVDENSSRYMSYLLQVSEPVEGNAVQPFTVTGGNFSPTESDSFFTGKDVPQESIKLLGPDVTNEQHSRYTSYLCAY